MMERIAEPELMDGAEQARAYAEADFSLPHQNFIKLFRQHFPGVEPEGHVLDLGCGPGDVTQRFARAFPHCLIHGVDGAATMLQHARDSIQGTDLAGRIEYVHALLPARALPRTSYATIISNSLLHHLPDPQVLWQGILQYGHSGTAVFIMDLLRPASHEQARLLVETHAADDPHVLREDFFNSLLAAYRPDEISLQLRQAGLNLLIRVTDDYHFIVHGVLP